MMHSTIPLFLVVVFTLQAVSARTVSDAAVKQESFEETGRIIGGRDAERGQFRYAVALHYNGRFICTGSIISPNHVMTAGHCVVLNGELQPADLFYVVANVDRTQLTSSVSFAEVFLHPEYDESSIDNDIAIFKTTESMIFNDEISAVCIAGPDTNTEEKAIAMGWGNTSRFRFITQIPETLQYVEQNIVSNSFCGFLNPGVNEDKLCAVGLFTGVCNGDSGGPLVANTTNTPPKVAQIGIASYINALVGCGKLGPAVFTRVSAFSDWIMNMTNNEASTC